MFVRHGRASLQQPSRHLQLRARTPARVYTPLACRLGFSLRSVIDDAPSFRDIILSRCAPGLGREPTARPIIRSSFRPPTSTTATNSLPSPPFSRHRSHFSDPPSRTPAFRIQTLLFDVARCGAANGKHF